MTRAAGVAERRFGEVLVQEARRRRVADAHEGRAQGRNLDAKIVENRRPGAIGALVEQILVIYAVSRAS